MPKVHYGRPPTDKLNDPAPPPIAVPEPPTRSMSKTRWIAYAKAVGVDDSGTKTQIIRRVANE